MCVCMLACGLYLCVVCVLCLRVVHVRLSVCACVVCVFACACKCVSITANTTACSCCSSTVESLPGTTTSGAPTRSSTLKETAVLEEVTTSAATTDHQEFPNWTHTVLTVSSHLAMYECVYMCLYSGLCVCVHHHYQV